MEEAWRIGLAARQNLRIVAEAFGAVVPGEIRVMAVAIVFAIGVIMLGGMGGKVGQRKAVMGADETDAAGVVAGEQVRRAA